MSLLKECTLDLKEVVTVLVILSFMINIDGKEDGRRQARLNYWHALMHFTRFHTQNISIRKMHLNLDWKDPILWIISIQICVARWWLCGRHQHNVILIDFRLDQPVHIRDRVISRVSIDWLLSANRQHPVSSLPGITPCLQCSWTARHFLNHTTMRN